MDINKFIDEIKNINLLIEDLTKKDIKANIKTTSKKIDDLSDRIKRYRNIQTIPYSKILIDFKNKVTLSVRAADEKVENILVGRQEFDVVGFNNDFFVLRDDKWDSKIGLRLTYHKLETYIEQTGEIKLFYNKYGELSGGKGTRSSGKEEIKYEIIKLTER